MGASADIQEAADKLAGALRGQGSDLARVVDARADVSISDESDEVEIRLILTLKDPVDATWPYEDVLALRHTVLRAAQDQGVEVSVIVRVVPATDAPQEDDERRLFGT